MLKKDAVQMRQAEEHKRFSLTVEKLKPCPKCGDERIRVYITGYKEPHMHNLLDTSVKCSACGYEYNTGQVQDSSSWALCKSHNIAVKAWNALQRPSINLESEAD